MPTIATSVSPRASDAGNMPIPDGVTILPSYPQTEDDIVRTVIEASGAGRPICVSAALTGLAGAGVPLYPRTGSVTRIFMERANTITVRPCFATRLSSGVLLSDDRTSCLVAPGVRIEEIRAALKKADLMYLPHPEYTRSMISGNVATNASGPRSFGIGPTRDHVRSLRVVLADGDVVTIRRGEVSAFDRRITGTLVGTKAHQLDFSLPSYCSPHIKNAAGLVVAPNMDLVDLFIGSEGSFGIFTEIELRVFPRRPIESKTLLLGSEDAALALAAALRHHRMNKESFMQNPLENNGGVLAIEFFDANALDISRSSNAWRIPADARAAIQVQFFGDDWEAAHTINGLLQRYDSNYVGIIPSDLASAFRTSTPGTVAESLKRLGLTKLGTDFAVSPDHFPELFEVYRSIRQECSECFTTPAGLPTSATWGHIGDCNLHMNLFPNSPSEAQFAEELYGRAVEKVLALGGTVTAEHGTGKKAVYAFGEKKHYLEHMLGREGLKEIAAVKNVFDPQGILNPGNLGFTYGQ